MTAPLTVDEQSQIDAVTADALLRLKSKVLGSLSCREAEQLLDGNFRLNDEVCSAMQQAWDCALRLDCRLCEVDRPKEEKNKQLQMLATARGALVLIKADLEGEILCAKLEVQSACAVGGAMQSSRLAAVLEANVKFREKCASFGRDAAAFVTAARQTMRDLGQHPDGSATADSLSIVKRWRVEFDTVRHENEAMLKALKHPSASSAVPSSALEERIDHTWRFLLELVGVFETLIGQMTPTGSEPAPGAASGEASPVDAEQIVEGSEKLREALEVELPLLLECKFLLQEASAKGKPLDLDSAIVRLQAAQRCQADAWHFLTSKKLDLADVCPTKFVEEMLPHPAAFAKAAPCSDAGDALDEFPPVIRALTYNIFLRAPAPQFTHNTDDDRKDERLRRFVEHLGRYDLICLQEAFGCYSSRRDWLIDVSKRLGYRSEHCSPTNVRPRFLIDGGLVILSRLPMDRTASLTFDLGTHLDYFSAKGAIYCRLQCGKSSPFLHVCTTHLQSTYSEDSYSQSQGIRHQQIRQLIAFLQEQAVDEEAQGDEAGDGSTCNGGGGGGGGGACQEGEASPREGPKGRRRWPLLLCGTLNFNGRRSAMDGTHSAEYCAVLGLLREGLGEVKDLVFDILGTHPVTYADTRLTEAGEVPAERVLTTPKVYENASFKRQCLDYMLFFPEQAPPAGSAVPGVPPEPREREGDGGACSSPSSTSPAAAPSHKAEGECMVPATCHVEKFLVDRVRDVGAPVTQLSDHYGLEAALTVVDSPALALGSQDSPCHGQASRSQADEGDAVDIADDASDAGSSQAEGTAGPESGTPASAVKADGDAQEGERGSAGEAPAPAVPRSGAAAAEPEQADGAASPESGTPASAVKADGDEQEGERASAAEAPAPAVPCSGAAAAEPEQADGAASPESGTSASAVKADGDEQAGERGSAGEAPAPAVPCSGAAAAEPEQGEEEDVAESGTCAFAGKDGGDEDQGEGAREDTAAPLAAPCSDAAAAEPERALKETEAVSAFGTGGAGTRAGIFEPGLDEEDDNTVDVVAGHRSCEQAVPARREVSIQ